MTGRPSPTHHPLRVPRPRASRGIAALLVLLSALPFTPPFSTCTLSMLFPAHARDVDQPQPLVSPMAVAEVFEDSLTDQLIGTHAHLSVRAVQPAHAGLRHYAGSSHAPRQAALRPPTGNGALRL